MKVKTPQPQYLLDRTGKKSLVVFPAEEYEELLEDLQDLAVIAERQTDERMSFKEFEHGLTADGLLQN